MMLPMAKLTIRPQNSSGWAVMSIGPGWMPWMMSAPSIRAITASPGMPSDSVGTKAVWAAALLADSGAVTPSMAPLPKRLGSLATFFSTAYDMKAAMLGPVPGKAPMKPPMPEPRNMGRTDWRTSSRLGSMERRVIFSLTSPSRLRLTDEISSAMPNSAMASATRLMASISSGISKSKRGTPELTSVPTVPSSRPNSTMASPLRGEPAASVAAAISPSSMIEKYSAAPNSSPTSAMPGANATSATMPNMEPMNEATVVMNSATPALPCLAMG